MINNIDADDLNSSSVNFGEYGQGETLEGVDGDLFWGGQWPRGEGKPWTEGPNQFKDVNLRMEIKPMQHGNITASTVLPVNLQIYDFHLLLCFLILPAMEQPIMLHTQIKIQVLDQIKQKCNK